MLIEVSLFMLFLLDDTAYYGTLCVVGHLIRPMEWHIKWLPRMELTFWTTLTNILQHLNN